MGYLIGDGAGRDGGDQRAVNQSPLDDAMGIYRLAVKGVKAATVRLERGRAVVADAEFQVEQAEKACAAADDALIAAHHACVKSA